MGTKAHYFTQAALGNPSAGISGSTCKAEKRDQEPHPDPQPKAAGLGPPNWGSVTERTPFEVKDQNDFLEIRSLELDFSPESQLCQRQVVKGEQIPNKFRGSEGKPVHKTFS